MKTKKYRLESADISGQTPPCRDADAIATACAHTLSLALTSRGSSPAQQISHSIRHKSLNLEAIINNIENILCETQQPRCAIQRNS